MPPSLEIRRYRPGDVERIRELNVVAMRAVGACVEGAPDPDLRDVEGTYLDGGGEFLVGELDGRVVAMGAFHPAEGYVTDFVGDLPEGTAEITRMRVDPDHQRRGYGQRIYDELERRAVAAGYGHLVLDTTARQVGAQRLYETNGFTEVHRERVDFGETVLEMIFYLKTLDEA